MTQLNKGATATKEEMKPEKKTNPENEKLGTSETRSVLHKQKMFKIIIPSTESDKTDVTVGINGYTYQIKRDEEVIVPESVIEVLRNAKAKNYRQKKRAEGQDGYELVCHEAMRYPFQLLGEYNKSVQPEG